MLDRREPPELNLLGTLVSWVSTLEEPLLELPERARIEQSLAVAHIHLPEPVSLFLTGFAADLALTLPADDPWHHLSARWGTHAIGESPPENDGAALDGKPFGTWRDGTDLAPLLHASPFEDPGLLSLARNPLSPPGAALLAAAFNGQATSSSMLASVAASGESGNVVGFSEDPAYRRAAALHGARAAMTQAIRWLVWRRRSYGVGDGWVGESGFRWAWRARRTGLGGGWSTDDVATAIEHNQIKGSWATVRDRRHERVDDDF